MHPYPSAPRSVSQIEPERHTRLLQFCLFNRNWAKLSEPRRFSQNGMSMFCNSSLSHPSTMTTTRYISLQAQHRCIRTMTVDDPSIISRVSWIFVCRFVTKFEPFQELLGNYSACSITSGFPLRRLTYRSSVLKCQKGLILLQVQADGNVRKERMTKRGVRC